MANNKTQEDWLELCKYCKENLLGYDNTMKFPRYLALRLKGLSEGKFIANKTQKPNANYSFKTILITCKFCNPKIKDYFYKNQTKIKDEQHKINLIMMFVEQEINNVAIKLKEREQSEKALHNIKFSAQSNIKNKANYKPFEHKQNKKFDDMW